MGHFAPQHNEYDGILHEELSMMRLCSILGKMPDELEHGGTTEGLGEERLAIWLLINSKRREWLSRNIRTTQEKSLEAKEYASQYVMAQVMVLQALTGLS